MAFCSRCGNKFEEEGKFCAECGEPRSEAKPDLPQGNKSERKPAVKFVVVIFTLLVLTGVAVAVVSFMNGDDVEVAADKAQNDMYEFENELEVVEDIATDDMYEDEVEGAVDTVPEEVQEDEVEVTAERTPHNWQSFQGPGFALSLPPGWEGGTEEEMDAIIEELRLLGPEGEKLAQEIDFYKQYLLFWAYDAGSLHPEQLLVNVNLVSENANISLEEYMKASYEELKQMYESWGYQEKIIEQGVVSLGQNERVARTIFEQEIFGEHTICAQYIIKKGNTFYLLTFSAESNKFNQYKETFDQVAGTLKII